MNERHRLLIGLLKLFDLALIVLAFFLTATTVLLAENKMPLHQFFAMRTRVANFGIVVLALIICHTIFSLCGLYQSRRLSKRRSEIEDVLQATTIFTASIVAISFVFRIEMVTVQFLAVFWLFSSIILAASRFIVRFFAAYARRRGKNLRYMLIVGTNPRAVDFAKRITANKELGYRVLGFVDDAWPGMPNFDGSDYQLVSGSDGLAEFLRWNVVDEVAIYLPFGSFYRHSSEVATICQQHGIMMRFNSDIFGLKATRWRSEDFDGTLHVATSSGTELAALSHIIKRMIDIVASATCLVLMSPILVGAAIAIKLTSHGPVFFKQQRIGINKRRFDILKFRTMVPNAEKLMAALETQNEVSGPVFKMKNDPRITSVGRFLRRSSIDELPQLLNVLKGDMSLVGPRPLPVRDFEGFSEDWQRRRFSVKPGITCLWQVNGRSGISFEQWMRLDLQYMDEWSLWLDLKILAKTVPAVIKGSGAA